MQVTIVQEFEWKEEGERWLLNPEGDEVENAFLAYVDSDFWRVWLDLTGKPLAEGLCKSVSEGKQKVEATLKEAGLCK